MALEKGLCVLFGDSALVIRFARFIFGVRWLMEGLCVLLWGVRWFVIKVLCNI